MLARPSIVRLISIAFLLSVAAIGCGGTLEKRSVVPTYDATAVRSAKSICPDHEVVSIAVTDNTARDPGTFPFAKDPALVYQRAFEESLTTGGCAAGGAPPALALQVNIGQLQTRALPDAMTRVKMIVTLVDREGRPIVNKTVSVEREHSCGALCSNEELSDVAKEVITESVMQSMAQLSDPMKKALSPRTL